MPDRSISLRWTLVVITVLTVVLVVLPFVVSGGAQRLRDRHGDPVAQVTPATVAVSMSGKLYHDPRCTFVHGRAVLMPARDAVARGFSPCPRCLGMLRSIQNPFSTATMRASSGSKVL